MRQKLSKNRAIFAGCVAAAGLGAIVAGAAMNMEQPGGNDLALFGMVLLVVAGIVATQGQRI